MLKAVILNHLRSVRTRLFTCIQGCGTGSSWSAKYGPQEGCGSYDMLGQITSSMLQLWPTDTPILFVGFEAGEDVRTGLLPSLTLTENPCHRAYEIFCSAMLDW
ncbi:MAG: hypothetical protein SGPRY_008459 [Prymnesium sp.]